MGASLLEDFQLIVAESPFDTPCESQAEKCHSVALWVAEFDECSVCGNIQMRLCQKHLDEDLAWIESGDGYFFCCDPEDRLELRQYWPIGSQW